MWLASIGSFYYMKPDPSGIGTHEQLGFKPCVYTRIFNIERCPSCGLTTAFTLIYRGRFKEAIEANHFILLWFPAHVLFLFFMAILYVKPDLKFFLWGLGGFISIGVIYNIIWAIEMRKILSGGIP